MKNLRIYISIVLMYFCLASSAQDFKPDWIEDRPSNVFDYVGIGMASKSTENYREVAKQAALSELVSQIEVTVSVNSLMTITEKDDCELNSLFSETVKQSTSKRLSNIEITDSWEDDNSFWVLYKLDKDEYAEQQKEFMADVTKRGIEFWQNGEQALRSGDLMTALDCFMDGLSVIEPFANENLEYECDGVSYSLGNLLYTSYRNIFNGIELKCEPEEVEIKSFVGNPINVALVLTREGLPLRNMHLRSEFVNGSGIISPIPATDSEGRTSFDIQNITSKNANQSLHLMLDTRGFAKKENESYKAMLKLLNKNIPGCFIKLQATENSALTAYVQSTSNNNKALVKNLKSFINNKYFDIVEDVASSDVIIKVDAKFEKGTLINGDISRMQEYFTTINISFIESVTGREISTYSLNSKRVLVPENASVTSARNISVRNAMKMVKKQLPEFIQNLKIRKNDMK